MRKFIYGIFLSAFMISCNFDTQFAKGKSLYVQKCQSCHMEDGSGLGSYIPSLHNKNMDFYLQVCTISKGKGNKNLVMPGFKLTDVEYANLINYLNEKFGNNKVYLPAGFKNMNTLCKGS
jgi:mono/diheme cytochrome c family protein